MQESLPLRRTQLQLANATHPPAAGDDVVDGVGDGVADSTKEVLLLVDAANGFNNLSRYGMLWTVRHRWRKLSKFTFDCYRHEIRLVCRQPGGAAEIILSKEGVTQSDHLAMALYSLALLPLAELLREKFLAILQPWYADDAAM